jgi:hypothetical protein
MTIEARDDGGSIGLPEGTTQQLIGLCDDYRRYKIVLPNKYYLHLLFYPHEEKEQYLPIFLTEE